jgi:hypothetical protein
MKRGTLFAVAGIVTAALLLLAIGPVRIAQQHRQRDLDDLKRWEGEGGPPPPADNNEASTNTR